MRTSTAELRNRTLDTAIELIQRQGVAATGLAEIQQRSGCPRGSFYHHFPGGKDQLIREALARAAGLRRQAITALIDQAPDIATGIRMVVIAAADHFAYSGFSQGCPVATVALERAAQDAEVADAAAAALSDWQEAIADGLVLSGIQPSRARSFARLCIAALEGGLIESRALRSAQPLHEIADELSALVQSL